MSVRTEMNADGSGSAAPRSRVQWIWGDGCHGQHGLATSAFPGPSRSIIHQSESRWSQKAHLPIGRGRLLPPRSTAPTNMKWLSVRIRACGKKTSDSARPRLFRQQYMSTRAENLGVKKVTRIYQCGLSAPRTQKINKSGTTLTHN